MSEAIHVVCPHCLAVNRLPSTKLADAPNCGQCKQTLFTGKPFELNATNLDRYLSRNDLPIVIDFWAPWCGPCRVMSPNFEQTAARLSPAMLFAKLNTEEEQQLAARFNIRSIPTLAVFKGGREIARQSGAVDAATLQRWLAPHLYKS